ncbi:hypothetical protein SLEP1_g32618 [Rubroshorea leprosula]|uniref:Cupin type-1 domain-containing protein n=1 Tax=Rubroshorea leprosula TaxID=152421 RepID=A0AAV5KDX1_9ROSI|nr:hypothetical protein SLEP1_g32618 [Rubroshorea leprosula]
MMKLSSPFLQLLTGLILLMGLSKPDPDPLQDYCIADTKFPSCFINGAPCINPNLASSSHFTTSVLGRPGNTKAYPLGFNATLTNTVNFPGINTLGLAMARIDIEPDGLVPPHTHPRTGLRNDRLPRGEHG